MQTFLALFLIVVSTWRFSYMLVYEDGPYDIFHSLRQNLSNRSTMQPNPTWDTLNKLFGCIYCMSIWVGGFASIFYAPNFQAWVLYTLLCSAGAIFIDKIHDRLLPNDG